MVGCADLGVRSYVSEPDRGRRTWKGKAAAKENGVCQPAADSRSSWTTPAAAARRTGGTAQRASLRDRGHAPGASARPSQYPQTPARARLWLQPRVAHAAADGRRYAAEPPGPRGGPSWCLDRPPGRALRACEAILGPRGPRCAGFVVGETGDRSIRTHDPRFTKSPFCHGLLAVQAGISILAARIRALIHQHASPHARFLHRTLFRSQLKPRPTWNRLEPPLSGHSADTAPHLCSFFAGVQQLAVARYPPGTGSAQILRNMSPNRRRVRCPSASRSQ